MSPNDLKSNLKDVAEELAVKQVQLFARRYCSNHQGMATPDSGIRLGNRWLCGACAQNRRDWLQAQKTSVTTEWELS